MIWPRSDDAEIARLRADVIKVRSDQRALQHQLEDAIHSELRSLAAVDASRAIQQRCRMQIEEHAAAIASLQDELAALIPDQRKANEQ